MDRVSRPALAARSRASRAGLVVSCSSSMGQAPSRLLKTILMRLS